MDAPRKHADEEQGLDLEPLLPGPEPSTSSAPDPTSDAADGAPATAPPPAYAFGREVEVECPGCKKRLLTNGDYVKESLQPLRRWYLRALFNLGIFLLLALFFGIFWDGLNLLFARVLGQASWSSCRPRNSTQG